MDKKITRQSLFSPCELHLRQSGDEESRTITGYAIVFNQRSVAFSDDETGSVYETISPKAVSRELLDASDIKMTMFHDRQLILARSNKGQGTLTYDIDEHGVSFAFDAPHTVDGDKALELVRRGDIAGCSFAFSTDYYDRDYVSRNVTTTDGKREVLYTVERITGIYDFTLAADPAYPSTECSRLRDVEADERAKVEQSEVAKREEQERAAANMRAVRAQLDEMKSAAETRLFC